jgi:hypothetical protein
LKKSKFKLSTQTVAVVLLGVVLLSIVGMVVYESFKAGTKDKVATAKTPIAVKTTPVGPTPTPTAPPKTKYSLDQGLESIKAVYANGSGLSDQNRPYIEAAFYNTAAAKNLTVDPVNCENHWPPSGGVSFETLGINAGGTATYVATEHWGGTEGDHRLGVYVDLNTDKISDIVCPAFHSGTY